MSFTAMCRASDSTSCIFLGILFRKQFMSTNLVTFVYIYPSSWYNFICNVILFWILNLSQERVFSHGYQYLVIFGWGGCLKVFLFFFLKKKKDGWCFIYYLQIFFFLIFKCGSYSLWVRTLNTSKSTVLHAFFYHSDIFQGNTCCPWVNKQTKLFSYRKLSQVKMPVAKGRPFSYCYCRE